MQSTNHVNNAITKNKQMYQHLSNAVQASNKTHLSTNYSSEKTQYYNDENSIKKQKRKKINKWLTLGFAGISILSIGTTVALQVAKNKINLSDVTKKVANTKTVQEGKVATKKLCNLIMNLDMLKNDIWTRISNWVSEKTPLKINQWFDKPIKEKYLGISKSINANKHASACEILEEHINTCSLTSFSDQYDVASKKISEELSKKENRVGTILFKGFKKQSPNEKLGERLKRGFSTFWEVGTKEVIIDDKLKTIYAEYSQGLKLENLPENIDLQLVKTCNSSDKNKAKEAFETLINQIKEILPEKSKEHAEAIAKALRDIDEIQSKGIKENMEKIRDLHLGNASVDILGMLSSLGLLSGAVILSDNKEERKSTVLNLGIPLLSALGCSFIGSLKNISGIKSALFGLGVGQLASISTKSIDNIINKSKNKKEKA